MNKSSETVKPNVSIITIITIIAIAIIICFIVHNVVMTKNISADMIADNSSNIEIITDGKVPAAESIDISGDETLQFFASEEDLDYLNNLTKDCSSYEDTDIAFFLETNAFNYSGHLPTAKSNNIAIYYTKVVSDSAMHIVVLSNANKEPLHVFYSITAADKSDVNIFLYEKMEQLI